MSLTYRPKENVLKEINDLKEKLNIKATSKLLDYVLLNYDRINARERELVQKNNNLQNQLGEMKGIIRRKYVSDFDFKQLAKLIE